MGTALWYLRRPVAIIALLVVAVVVAVLLVTSHPAGAPQIRSSGHAILVRTSTSLLTHAQTPTDNGASMFGFVGSSHRTLLLTAGGGHMIRALLPLSSGGLTVVAEHLPLLVLIALLVLVAVARLAVANRTRRLETDPQRLFTAGQRRLARRLAQGRCEQESLPFVRCRRVGAHADHWFPWSRGGASTDQNLVWACSRHNLAKSSRVPTAFQTIRLEARRARYFPGDVSTVAGEWFESGNTRPQRHRSDW